MDRRKFLQSLLFGFLSFYMGFTFGKDGIWSLFKIDWLKDKDNEEEAIGKGEKVSNQIFYIKEPPPPLIGCKCDGVTDDSIAFKKLNDFLAANGGGTMKLPRSTKEITILNQEIDLNSNVDIEGYGWNSQIKCMVGSSGNGKNILKAFEKSNIRISKLTIENMGFGKSGAWEPLGTFDGAGACILGVGCENFVVDSVTVLNGGGANSGEGVGNIYLSCCKNSKIINNYVSRCDNGICVDSWYNQLAKKESFINDGVVIQGNTITNGSGRGIVIENRSNVQEKGSITVNGNTINKMAYAGIQGNNLFNCSITGNTIDGDKSGRTYGNSKDNMWYGMEFVSGSKQAVISGNTIKNIKFNGIRCLEAQNLSIISNVINNTLDFAIFVKNKNEDMFNVKIENNNMDVLNNGVLIDKEVNSNITLKNNSCSHNTIKYNTTGGSVGIEFNNQELGKNDGNIVSSVSVVKSEDSIGIRVRNPVKCSLNSNTVCCTFRGIDIKNDVNSISDSNILDGCSTAYRLDNCQGTSINSKIIGGENAFELINGKTEESQKCKAYNCDIIGTMSIKTGNGLIYWGIGNKVPNKGAWDDGDRIRNISPTVGGYSEWIYVSGKWRASLSID